MIKKTLAAALVTLLPVVAAADSHGMEGDAAAGEKVFKKCKACHQVGEGAENKTGPVLNGVVGRVIGSHEGFKYSGTLADMGAAGDTWTVENLDHFLEKPKDFAKGTKMAFAGLKKEDDRKNVIAYLATFAE
ncbi:c-type cytochrome [Sagittula sp. S175]|uniref:c-type cytochrome n=1 Tax=Sagittula sp. S175 TaxID=3415129 RepID=UPI003C7C1F25